MDHIEIREKEPSEVQRRYGVTGSVFVVWDTKRNMRVPFGSYRTRKAAEARVRLMEQREAEADD
ncbi:hypothetical protein [Streptomyces cinereoruber]|uniref:hypothetical protein n=1 Tax=Streptomyces cinereoruber TaxID=67260 RepID=UPI003C2D75AB